MNNKIKELSTEDVEMISEFEAEGKLHPDFLSFATYDMVQCGYPYPDHGEMIARGWGGTDEQGRLLPSKGMWCKVEDVEKFLKQTGNH